MFTDDEQLLVNTIKPFSMIIISHIWCEITSGL